MDVGLEKQEKEKQQKEKEKEIEISSYTEDIPLMNNLSIARMTQGNWGSMEKAMQRLVVPHLRQAWRAVRKKR